MDDAASVATEGTASSRGTKRRFSAVNLGRSSLAIHRAMAENDADTVLEMLEENWNYSLPDGVGLSPLMYGVRHDAADSVKALLTVPDLAINAVDDTGRSALMHAVSVRSVQILRILLDHRSVDVNAADQDGVTALALAASLGVSEAVPLLLSCGANINCRDSAGLTPLIVASWRDDAAIVELLMRANADVNAVTRRRRTALIEAASRGCSAAMRLLLSSPRINLNAQDEGGYTAIATAAQAGHHACLMQLVEASCDPTIPESHGLTPLMLAVGYNHPQIVASLVRFRVRADCRSTSGVFVVAGGTKFRIAVGSSAADIAAQLQLRDMQTILQASTDVMVGAPTVSSPVATGTGAAGAAAGAAPDARGAPTAPAQELLPLPSTVDLSSAVARQAQLMLGRYSELMQVVQKLVRLRSLRLVSLPQLTAFQAKMQQLRQKVAVVQHEHMLMAQAPLVQDRDREAASQLQALAASWPLPECVFLCNVMSSLEEVMRAFGSAATPAGSSDGQSTERLLEGFIACGEPQGLVSQLQSDLATQTSATRLNTSTFALGMFLENAAAQCAAQLAQTRRDYAPLFHPARYGVFAVALCKYMFIQRTNMTCASSLQLMSEHGLQDARSCSALAARLHSPTAGLEHSAADANPEVAEAQRQLDVIREQLCTLRSFLALIESFIVSWVPGSLLEPPTQQLIRDQFPESQFLLTAIQRALRESGVATSRIPTGLYNCRARLDRRVGHDYAVSETHSLTVRKARLMGTQYDVSLKAVADTSLPSAIQFCKRPWRHAAVNPIEAVIVDGGIVLVQSPWVLGQTLDAWLTSATRSPAVMIQMFRQVLEALSWLHSRELVHGALKPTNIIVTPTDNVVVLDAALRAGARMEDDIAAAARLFPNAATLFGEDLMRSMGNHDAGSRISAADALKDGLLRAAKPEFGPRRFHEVLGYSQWQFSDARQLERGKPREWTDFSIAVSLTLERAYWNLMLWDKAPASVQIRIGIASWAVSLLEMTAYCKNAEGVFRIRRVEPWVPEPSSWTRSAEAGRVVRIGQSASDFEIAAQQIASLPEHAIIQRVENPNAWIRFQTYWDQHGLTSPSQIVWAWYVPVYLDNTVLNAVLKSPAGLSLDLGGQRGPIGPGIYFASDLSTAVDTARQLKMSTIVLTRILLPSVRVLEYPLSPQLRFGAMLPLSDDTRKYAGCQFTEANGAMWYAVQDSAQLYASYVIQWGDV